MGGWKQSCHIRLLKQVSWARTNLAILYLFWKCSKLCGAFAFCCKCCHSGAVQRRALSLAFRDTIRISQRRQWVSNWKHSSRRFLTLRASGKKLVLCRWAVLVLDRKKKQKPTNTMQSKQSGWSSTLQLTDTPGTIVNTDREATTSSGFIEHQQSH